MDKYKKLKNIQNETFILQSTMIKMKINGVLKLGLIIVLKN